MRRTGLEICTVSFCSFPRFPSNSFTEGETLAYEPNMWDDLKGQFMNHIAEVNADLKAAGRPPLGSELNKQ